MVLQLISASGTKMTCICFLLQLCAEALGDSVFVKFILIINQRAV